jgi:carotenoid cleavage dioxygenase-like enzyme
MIHSTANTHIYFHNGVLLALKEDSPPYALDPNTLRTIGTSCLPPALISGLYTFDGTLPSPTFTAHPKVDSRTGSLYAYGYEARGDGSTDICFFGYTKDGKKIEECWVRAPFTGAFYPDVHLTL